MTTRSLLVPLDGSPRAEAAIPHALALRPPGGSLVLLHVVPEPEFVLGNPLWDVEAWQAAARVDLERVALRIGGGVPIETVVVTGDAATRIIQVAAERRAELIVMTTRGLGALGRVLFGSTADRVARASPVPVFMHRANEPEGGHVEAEPISRIVVPLDGSALAETAVPLAVEIALRLGAPIWLVRALDPGAVLAAEDEIAGEEVDSTADTAEELAARARERARQSLRRVAAQIQTEGAAVSLDLLRGSPFAAITEALAPGDLVVMTSHGRTGFTRWLLGSVAEKLIRDSPAPVLLVPAAARAANTGEAPPA